MKPQTSCCEKKSISNEIVDGDKRKLTNSLQHLYSCNCNQLFLVKEGFVYLLLTIAKQKTSKN